MVGSVGSVNKHIAAAEDLLEQLYRETDARTVAEMEEPQVVTEMAAQAKEQAFADEKV